METGLHIGTVVGKESIEPLTDAIIRIMSTHADQKTIRAALDLVGRAAEVSNVSIGHVNIDGGTHHNYPVLDPSSDVVDDPEDEFDA